MNAIKTIKETGLVINIPHSIKKQIDSEFTEYSQTHLDKIYFIVYKICKEKSYQLNIRNHADLLAFNTGTLCDIISRLGTLLIINTKGNYVVGVESNTYSLLKNYDCESEDNYRKFYYPSKMKIPNWVQQYITDGYTVYNKKFSKFRKSTPVKVLSYDDIVAENIKLKAEIASLRTLISVSNINVSSDELINPETSNEELYCHGVDHTMTSSGEHSFEYDGDKFLVDNWSKINDSIQLNSININEVYSIIGDARDCALQSFNDVSFIKIWDYNENIYTVSVQ